MSTRRCVLCTQVAEVHPEVGDGYIPHPFQPAAIVHSPTYDGPERRHLIRRMDDRIAAIERVMQRS